MDTKEIEKLNKLLGLPRVILEYESYRFVATTVVTGAAEKTDNAWNVVMPSDSVTVRIESEVSSKDSLGNTRWTSCNFNTAKEFCFACSIGDGFRSIDVAFQQLEKVKAPKVK